MSQAYVVRGCVFRLIEAVHLLEKGTTVCTTFCATYHFGCRSP